MMREEKEGAAPSSRYTGRFSFLETKKIERLSLARDKMRTLLALQLETLYLVQ